MTLVCPSRPSSLPNQSGMFAWISWNSRASCLWNLKILISVIFHSENSTVEIKLCPSKVSKIHSWCNFLLCSISYHAMPLHVFSVLNFRKKNMKSKVIGI